MKCELIENSGDKCQFRITGTTADELGSAIDRFFANHGYAKKSDDMTVSTYTKGNRVLRILFGAFAKYHKINAGVTPLGDDSFGVILQRDSTGVSGGLIGVSQVRKEFKKLVADFELFTSF